MSSLNDLAPPGWEFRFRALLDGLIDAAVIVDRQLKPRAWNAAYAEAVGVRGRRLARLASAPGVCCHHLFELEVCRSDCLALRCFAARRFVRVDEIQGGSKIVAGPGDAPLGDGPRRHGPLIVSAIPLGGDGGDVAVVLEIYRDVKAEAAIQERYKALLTRERHRADDLEEQVRRRTRELERTLEELQAARAQLILSEKLSSLAQLVAGIAHEINNPINFIYGNIDFLDAYVRKFFGLIRDLEALVKEPADRARIDELKRGIEFDYLVEDTEKLLGCVRTGAERTAAIVRDLRAFIHGGVAGGSGGTSAERQPVALERCLETTLNLVAHETRGRIDVARDYEPDLPLVMGNENQLNQVFMNLVVNAIQAITGKGTIRIGVHRRDGGVAVEVSDSGVGISEADQLRVFDPFFTTKPVGQGTGLGLSISYSVVDAHGGKLSLRSEPGKGSTFTVWLPAEPQNKDPQDPHAV